jgi:preprotein translocase subunit SecA
MAGRGVDIRLGGNPSTPTSYEEIKSLGGLFVLGTERHEARRIDNQLRGRSGRQGDPGETQFFVSMEDSLMRIFAADIIKKMIGGFGMPEDMPIEHSVITRSLETAQTKIEGFNFDARKQVLEFDDVLNHQRKIIYEKRRKVLTGSNQDIENRLIEMGGDDVKKIIEERKKEIGEENFFKMARGLILQVNDLFWVDHLELMEYARGSVNLRAYGQRDPLVEYKKEGLRLFKEMEQGVADKVLSILPSLGGTVSKINVEEKRKLQEVHENARIIGGESDTKNVASSSENKVGRNDPCPCGSGKKYKKCHGAQ